MCLQQATDSFSSLYLMVRAISRKSLQTPINCFTPLKLAYIAYIFILICSKFKKPPHIALIFSGLHLITITTKLLNDHKLIMSNTTESSPSED
jgi:hypothetical protein